VSRCSYWFKFLAMDRAAAKERAMGLRSRFAWALRGVADAIDGAESITIDIASIPHVSHSDRVAVVDRGLQHSCNLFVELVKQESIDKSMRKHCPELYAEGEA